MRIIFVRHGHPDYTLDCLTELGHSQAAAAAERLKNEPICAVYSSTKGRAVETAEHIARKHGLPIKERLDFMRELSWGCIDDTPIPFNGQPWYITADMVSKGLSLTDPNWRENEYFCKSKLVPLEEPLCEQLDQFLSRYGLDREGNYYRVRERNDSTIVLASHAGSSGMALSHLFNLPFPFVIKALSPNFTGITVVEFDGEEGSLVSPSFEIMNDARHIQGISTEVFFGN